jgi:hypothetical protein
MNFVFLSPHFPSNYYQFCIHLRNMGANVLGLADEPYDVLRPELKEALTEYYWVPNMHNYGELVRALGYFTHRYGKLDRLDSMSEYWLEAEARLRTDFNIDGLKTGDMPCIKRKSEMKEIFKKAGVAVARGQVVRNPAQGRKFVDEVGYPIVAKPDVGVGASKTYEIHSDQELADFWGTKPAVDYFLEEYIHGFIQTFDGLTDQQGNVVFSSSLQYNRGVMEIVNEDDDLYYYTLREIPVDLEKAGRGIAKTFGVRERFFHFEFFRTPDSRLVALEVNMRPPGGWTTDMMNYTNDIDVYHEWANIVMNNRFSAPYTRPYHCCYIGRRSHKLYVHKHDEVLRRFGGRIVYHAPMSGIFSAAMGDYGYLARSPDLNEIIALAEFIRAKAA